MLASTKHRWVKYLINSSLTGLLSLCLTPLPSAAQQSSNSKDNVKKVQQTLRDKGYDPGPVDGVMGSQTRHALGQYQKAQGYPVTDRVDSRTAENLGVREESSWRAQSAGTRFKTGGQDFGKGGAGFGKEIAKGKPIDAGRDLGEGFGAGGKNIGLGVAKTVTH
jgi:peptidoglycan hydrolase-like protein with peptidoglycan-binding domain